MSKVLRLVTAGTLAGMFATAASLFWQENSEISLTPEGEKIHAQLLGRMKSNLAYGDPSDVDRCAARYIAHQQAGRLEQDEKFRKESGETEQEIERVIAVNHQWDTQYALHAYTMCMTGSKPNLFTPGMFRP